MELLHEELTQKIIGAAFKVYNTIGYGFQEKEYHTSLCIELGVLGLGYKKEFYTDLKYEGQKIRGYFADIIVEGKVVVELKVANKVYPKHFYQVNQYLKNNNLQLGLIIVFSPNGVIIRRVANILIGKKTQIS